MYYGSLWYILVYEMEEIDKMTMALLMNKSKYNRYISKTDPGKYEEQQRDIEKMRKYARRILHLFEDMLNNPDISVRRDIQDGFTHFTKACIYHFETMDETQDSNHSNGHERNYGGYGDDDDNADEETMFGNCDDNKESVEPNEDPTRSYWGKSVKKMNTLMTMDAFTKRKDE